MENILEGKKLELEYPASWQYKIIGIDENEMHTHTVRILKEKPFSLMPSNKSSSGKFVSLTLEVMIYSDDERLYIYEELRKTQCIKYIL